MCVDSNLASKQNPDLFAAALSRLPPADCYFVSFLQDCCQKFIRSKNKTIVPDTPEQLISARYSAFCEKDAKFIKRTNHRNNPALQGSKTADDAGVQKRCTYEEDLAVRGVCTCVYTTS